MAETPSPYETQAKIVERLYTLTLLIALLCIIALFGPDHSLLTADASLKIPYIGVDVPVASFLIFGPAALLIAWIYLQLAFERLSHTPTPDADKRGFYLFAVDSLVFKIVWLLTLYGVMPLVLVVFVWKALPRPEAWMLLVTLMIATFVSAILFARRRWREGRYVTLPVLTLAAVAMLSALVAVNAPDLLLDSLLPHRKIDLVRANFKDKDLRETNLENAQMEGANLENAALQRANLAGADLRGAKMMGALLQGANLQRAMLSGANLTEAWLQPDTIRGRSTDLRHALLVNTTLKLTILHKANLSGAELRGSTIEKTSFTWAKLIDARIVHSMLSAVDFTEAILSGTQWQETVIADTIFARATLTDAEFEMATITRSTFAAAHLEGASFRHAVLVNVSFVRATGLKAIDWSNIKMCSSDFADAELHGAKFEGAILRGAFLQGTHFDGANLKNADLTGALLSGAHLPKADLTEAILTSATLTGADLRGAILERTDLSGADLTGAKFDASALASAHSINGAIFSAEEFEKLTPAQRIVAKQATPTEDKWANRKNAGAGGRPFAPKPDDAECTREPTYGGR